MGNQQNQSRFAFISNIDSFSEIIKVIEEFNLILSNPKIQEQLSSRFSIKLLNSTTKLERIKPSKSFFHKTLWKYYLGQLSFLIVIIRGGVLEHLEINFFDLCELLEKLLNYMELVNLLEKQKKLKKKEKQMKNLCQKCGTRKTKIYLPCYHGLCENCFEEWREFLTKNIKCLFCDVNIAYDKTFLDGKVFILENDLEQLNETFKEQINDFFKERTKN